MIGDSCEDVGEVGLGIDGVHLGGFDDGADVGGDLNPPLDGAGAQWRPPSGTLERALFGAMEVR
jgi:hypothetical protein